jgi:hypothetical protein
MPRGVLRFESAPQDCAAFSAPGAQRRWNRTTSFDGNGRK